MRNKEDLGASADAETGSRASTEPVSAVSALSGFDPARVMRDALTQIRDMEERPFIDWPQDWSEQIAACPECQAYANHPVQQGICTTHRRPIYARDRHERHEREAMGWRMASVAREALAAIAMEARQGPDRETGLDGEAATARACKASPTPSEETGNHGDT